MIPEDRAKEPASLHSLEDYSLPIADKGWWRAFLIFLWQGGFRSLIVLVVVIGAILIAWNNDKVCQGVPTSQILAPQAKDGAENATTKSEITLIQPNPLCDRYYELTLLVVGGYLGLSVPSMGKSVSEKMQEKPRKEAE